MVLTKNMLFISMTLSLTACHANTDIIFRFLDAAGYYRIKMEPVKDANPQINTYTALSTTIRDYMQGCGQFVHLINLPDQADYLRVSIRKFQQPNLNKPGNFDTGVYTFFDAQYLRSRAAIYQNSKKFHLGISIFNQFNPRIQPSVAIETDSLEFHPSLRNQK